MPASITLSFAAAFANTGYNTNYGTTPLLGSSQSYPKSNFTSPMFISKASAIKSIPSFTNMTVMESVSAPNTIAPYSLSSLFLLSLTPPPAPKITYPVDGHNSYYKADMVVRWASSSGATSYGIRMRDTTTGEMAIGTETEDKNVGNFTSYWIYANNFEYGHQYRIAVTAKNTRGSNCSPTVSFTILPLISGGVIYQAYPPPAPKITYPVDGHSYYKIDMAVKWASSPEATSYGIRMRDTTTGDMVIGTDTEDKNVGNTASYTIPIDLFTEKHTYQIAVVAKNMHGSNCSPTVSFTIIPFKIYVPGYDSDGSNADYTDKGEWENKKIKLFSSTETNWGEFIANFSGEDEAKNSTAAIVLFFDALLRAYVESTTTTDVQITIQQKGDEYRTVVQIGIEDNAWQKITKDYSSSLNHFQFTDSFGDSIVGNVDPGHKDDPFIGYLSFNENGKVVLIPKLRAGDKLILASAPSDSPYRYYYRGQDITSDLHISQELPDEILSTIRDMVGSYWAI